MDFEEANKVVHAVETQWHHPILTRHGFVPETKEAVGFVRSYVYKHADGRVIECTTGSSADYWTDQHTKATGYWASLEKHVSR